MISAEQVQAPALAVRIAAAPAPSASELAVDTAISAEQAKRTVEQLKK